MPSKNKKQKSKKAAGPPAAPASTAAAKQNPREFDASVDPDELSDWEQNNLHVSTPNPTPKQHSGSNNHPGQSPVDHPAAEKYPAPVDATKDGSEPQRVTVFYGPSVCYHCGERGHLASGCATPYCMSCDVWGHAKGQCSDACERCGRPHERRDGICRTFHCEICGLYGHRPSQCPGMLCTECGCYGHSSNRCQKDKPCPLCGDLGHGDTSCPMVCSRCSYPGHRIEDCMMKQCDRCSMLGHAAEECLFTNNSITDAAEAESAWDDEGSVPAVPAAAPSKETAKPTQHQPIAGQPAAAPSARQLFSAAAGGNAVPQTYAAAPAMQSAETLLGPGLAQPSSTLLQPSSTMAPYNSNAAAAAPAAMPLAPRNATAHPVAAVYAVESPAAQHRPGAVHASRGPPPGFSASAAGVHALPPHMQQKTLHPPGPPGFGNHPPAMPPVGLPQHLVPQEWHPAQQAAPRAQPAEDTECVARPDGSDEDDLDEMLGLLGA